MFAKINRRLQNTMYACGSGLDEVHDFGSDSVFFTPHGPQGKALAILLAGASMISVDSWLGERG